MQESTYDIHPSEARWTHVALRVDDIDATIEFYTSMTPMVLIEKRQDENGFGAWLGMPGATNNPFILVVAQFFEGSDPFADAPKEVLAPFAHLGVELPTKQAIDDMAERAAAAGCLAMPATMMPAPIGYICMVRDPDGNMVEFSWDQGVFATLARQVGPTHRLSGATEPSEWRPTHSAEVLGRIANASIPSNPAATVSDNPVVASNAANRPPYT